MKITIIAYMREVIGNYLTQLQELLTTYPGLCPDYINTYQHTTRAGWYTSFKEYHGI